MVAMPCATLEHARLTAALIAALSAELQGKRCAVFDSNARVRVKASGNAYYPDLSIVCDNVETDPEDDLSMSNPTVLVEVLSPSTFAYDRTDKLADYQRIPSVMHVVHVAHDEPRIDLWSRKGDGWECASFGPGRRASLSGVGCTLDVSAIYRDPLAAG